MGLVGISTHLRPSRSWACLRFKFSMHLESQEPIGTDTICLTALLLQHPFLSIDLELGQDLNLYTIFAYRCLQDPTPGLFDHAGDHHCLRHLDRIFCRLLVQPAWSLLESENQRPLHERIEAVVYKCSNQHCHRLRALDPSDANDIQAQAAQEAEAYTGMYHVTRRLVSSKPSKFSGHAC